MWFKDWFNSPYYHILYQHRDETEAVQFVENLCSSGYFPGSGRLLDVACGAGRHSVSFSKKGFFVTGTDLSPENIEQAKVHEVPGKLEFFVHDMRNVFRVNYYDVVVNLFTSFGYFKSDREHLKALKAFHSALKKDGVLVLDFLNVKKVSAEMVASEVVTRDGIDFMITRRFEKGFILKTIEFTDQGTTYEFVEKVRAYDAEELSSLIIKAGFKIINLSGNYRLEPFDVLTSPRLIIFAVK